MNNRYIHSYITLAMSKFMSTKAGRQARADAKGSISSRMTVKARVWLEKDGETFLASGRVALLEKIDTYGSVTKAAKSMGMSYRHAWLLLDAMNAFRSASPRAL